MLSAALGLALLGNLSDGRYGNAHPSQGEGIPLSLGHRPALACASAAFVAAIANYQLACFERPIGVHDRAGSSAWAPMPLSAAGTVRDHACAGAI